MAGQTIAKSAEKHWKDMGILTLTFYTYTRPNGTVVAEMYVPVTLSNRISHRVDRHDKMAAYMGAHDRRFIDMYTNQVDDIQRKMIEYTKLITRSLGTHAGTELGKPSMRLDLQIQIQSGYPVIPPAGDGVPQTKEELEDLLRRYLNAHYSASFQYDILC